MPTSTEIFKDVIFNHINYVTQTFTNFKILDVGAGYGTFGRALNHLNIDAIEVHEPYIVEYGLEKFYKNVYNSNILDFDIDNYDYIIMGDVLEHIPKEDSQKLIQKIFDKKIKCLVGVPFLMEQSSKFEFLGKEWDVLSEIHHQTDLTERVMISRYPSLNPFLIFKNEYIQYGYYTNYIKYVL